MELPGLRSARLSAVLTQADIARRANVAEGTVISAENGKKVRISTVRKLAEALGVTPQKLLQTESMQEGKK